MKRQILYIIPALMMAAAACSDFNLPSNDKVGDGDLLASEAGMNIYMAEIYSRMPWEDFKYKPYWGFDGQSWLGSFGQEGTGEALNREKDNPFTSEGDLESGRGVVYFSSSAYAWKNIRMCNHLIETLPDYKANFSEMSYNDYLGQAWFCKAYVYTQLARRYGGVPLVKKEIGFSDIADCELPRASEEDTWDYICECYDNAASLLADSPKQKGMVDRWAALAFKAEAMLYAGSIAKYNETVPGRLTGIGEKSGNRVIGFDPDTWQDASKRYFSEAYKAAAEVIESNKFKLYRKAWNATDPQAQYKNMVDMFFDEDSPENMLVRYYMPSFFGHGYEAYSVPYQFKVHLAGGTCPTLDFVELFDGLERYPDGTIKVTTGNSPTEGNYLMFDSPMDMFRNAEPRLRAYVIFPMDSWRGEVVDVRAGVYTGPEPIKPLLSDYSYANASQGYQNLSVYTGSPKQLYLSSNATSQEVVNLPGGETMNAAGDSGPFYSIAESTLTGFYGRKWLDPSMAASDIGEGKSYHHFVLMRYADVLLAAAEAAVELSLAGAPNPYESAGDMLALATESINDIRSRAGAVLLEGPLTASEASRDIVRKERRKELAFEHKSKYDIRRWRVIHEEGRDGFWGEQRDSKQFSSGSTYRFRGLYPFYSTASGKYFFDSRFNWVRLRSFNYTAVSYYFKLPSAEVSKSKYIDQQPNR